MKIVKYTLICFALFSNFDLLFGQKVNPDVRYRSDFHKMERQYYNEVMLGNPDLKREDIRLLMKEYYNKNYKPSRHNTEIRDIVHHESNNISSESFNQVPDSIEYAALRTFFENLNGPEWTRRDNWDYPFWKDPSTVDYLDFVGWRGVTVFNGDVVGIDFYSNNLQGTIPTAINQLTSLQSLALSGNPIVGPIPPELSTLPLLQFLDLTNNQLTGPLPVAFKDLPQLQFFYLNTNNINDSIPSAWGEFPSMMELDLSNNNLMGKIPDELGNLNFLIGLYLSYNQFADSLPSTLGSLSNLQYLYISGNQISGSLPPELGQLHSLLDFDLSYNDLSGSMPTALGGLDAVEYFFLQGNNIEGPLPSGIGGLSSVISLHLEDNKISGPLPSELNGLTSLQRLYLSKNQVNGSLNFLNNIPGLKNLIIDENKFTYDNLELLYDNGSLKFPNITTLNYIPQFTVLGDSGNLFFPEGESLIIPFSPGGEHNLYQWQKFDGSNWQDMPGADSAEYYKPNAAFADAGTYRCKVTNEWVIGLTLYSHEITVNITEALPEPPVADSVHICPGQTATFTATGSGAIYWFASETEGDTLEIGATFTTPALDSTTVYYVSQKVDGLHSERIPVAAMVGPIFTVSQDQTVCMGTDIDVTLVIEGENLNITWDDFGNDLVIVVSPDTTTTYAYTVEDAYGCAISGSITVTVLDSLIAEIIPPAPVCPGAPAIFEAVEVPGATYSWEPGGLTDRIITVESSEMQQYTLTVTNSNGCTAMASEFIPFAALATVSEDQTICVIDSVLLSADGGDSYLWNTGDTTSQITFAPSSAGEYTFTVNVTTDSCTSSQDVIVTVEPYCPGTPVSFYARAINTSAISLQWQEPVGNQQQYVVQKRNAAGTYVTLETLPVGVTSWIDEGLEADSIYYYGIYSEVASVKSDMRTASARTFPERENYVHETILLIENIKDVNLIPGLEDHKRSSSWTYLNGLGSEMQTIIAAASPSGRDMVQPVVYDDNGMVSEQYLPYTIENSPKGNFRGEAKQEVLDFYDEVDPPAAIATTAFPFATTVYGNSPQNKVIAQGAHGEEWQVETGRSVSLTTATNGAGEVIDWEYNAVTGYLTADQYYPVAQLTKAITVSEDGEKAVSYKDMLGKELKQEVFLSDSEKVETYYVYNNKGQLLFKVTPLVVEQATSSGNLPFSISKTLIEDLCYSYFYDERGRLIETRWSDKESVFYVYDQWDRLALSQDGNQRQRNEWSFTKYDRYNRAILSGLHKTQNPASRSEMKAAVDGHYAQSGSTRFERYGGSVHGYTNTSYPAVSNENDYLSVSYYDSYDFITDVPGFGQDYGFEATVLGCQTIAQGEYCFPSEESKNIEGVQTGSKTKVLGRDKWLASVVYYDERGRGIQTVTQNYIGSIDRQSSLYNFAGWLLSSYLSHNGADGKSRGIKRRYMYDHTGRLLEGYHELFDSGISQGEVFLAENKYNELGQLIEKNLHIEEGAPIKSIDYRYNIRGWLKSINGANSVAGEGINANDARQDLFGMELIYNGVLNGIQNNERTSKQEHY